MRPKWILFYLNDGKISKKDFYVPELGVWAFSPVSGVKYNQYSWYDISYKRYKSRITSNSLSEDSDSIYLTVSQFGKRLWNVMISSSFYTYIR